MKTITQVLLIVFGTALFTGCSQVSESLHAVKSTIGLARETKNTVEDANRLRKDVQGEIPAIRGGGSPKNSSEFNEADTQTSDATDLPEGVSYIKDGKAYDHDGKMVGFATNIGAANRKVAEILKKSGQRNREFQQEVMRAQDEANKLTVPRARARLWRSGIDVTEEELRAEMEKVRQKIPADRLPPERDIIARAMGNITERHHRKKADEMRRRWNEKNE